MDVLGTWLHWTLVERPGNLFARQGGCEHVANQCGALRERGATRELFATSQAWRLVPDHPPAPPPSHRAHPPPPAGYSWDFVFDWTILKFQRAANGGSERLNTADVTLLRQLPSEQNLVEASSSFRR